ncbi:hypothetical protein BDW02DRAFT_178976 [Decorospora gaudefroyi]|uniref:C2H2-type domain-containing protein n=1 Tax=Decorospora gaudefroyi TaxID=184978 RepID=A0A6A5JWY1_9PLEO|nr:hypothetical protein BDW02DRAFT_178976 [Decorospora gaudefroyi]
MQRAHLVHQSEETPTDSLAKELDSIEHAFQPSASEQEVQGSRHADDIPRFYWPLNFRRHEIKPGSSCVALNSLCTSDVESAYTSTGDGPINYRSHDIDNYWSTESELSWRPSVSSAPISEPRSLDGCELPVFCSEPGCDKFFTGEYRKGNLRRHIMHYHGHTGRYNCESQGCAISFKRNDARLRHYRKCHPDLASPFVARRPWARRDSGDQGGR